MTEETANHDLSEDQLKLCRSWEKLQCEIWMKAPNFSFWLVPEYTQEERLELTPEHFFKIQHIMETFGATADAIKAVRKSANEKPDEEPIAEKPAKKSKKDVPY